jgi:tetratricopeptide (TPR) repeat protein
MPIQFVGREKEIALLEKLLEETRKNLGKVIMISAEPGYGKSELVHHFLSRNDAGCYIAEKQCFSKNMSDAYLPAKDILLQLNADAFSGTEDKKTVYDRLSGIIGQAGPDWISVIPVVGSFVTAGIRTMQAAREHFSKQVESNIINGKEDIQRLFDNELRKLAAKQPVIIFIDDIQWADASTLDLIFALYLSQRITPFPLMLIACYRSNELKTNPNLEGLLNNLRSYMRPELHIKRTDQWLHEMTVPPFGLEEIDCLIRNRFPANDFPSDLTDNLHRIANSNVLFATSIVDYLLLNEDIYADAQNVYHVRPISLSYMPETAKGIIAERVRLLNDDLRDILNCASIGGEQFSLQMIAGITGENKIKLSKGLNELSSKHGLIESLQMRNIEEILLYIYSFTHSLIYKYVYETLDENTRRIYHNQAADVIKSIFGEELEKMPEIKADYNRHMQISMGLIDPITYKLTGQHYERQEDLDFLLEASKAEVDQADQAYKTYSMEECLEHAQKAMDMLINAGECNPEILEVRFNALWKIFDALLWLGHYLQVEEVANQMASISEKQQNSENTSIAYNKIGQALRSEGDNDGALLWHKKALEIYEYNNNREGMATSYNYIGNATTKIYNYEEAITWYEKSIEIYESNNDKKGMAKGYNNIGIVLEDLGNYDRAILCFQKAQDIYEKNNQTANLAKVYSNIGSLYGLKKDYDKAVSWYQKALEIDENNKDRVQMASTFNNIGWALQSKGNYSEAIPWHQKALTIYEGNNDMVGIAKAYLHIGVAFDLECDYKEAIPMYKKSLEFYESSNDKVTEVYDNIGRALALTEDYDNAILWYEKTIMIAKGNNDKEMMAKSYNKIGWVLISKEDYDMAISNYQKALEIYEKDNNRSGIFETYDNIGWVQQLKCDYTLATSSYLKALEIAEGNADMEMTAMIYNNLGDIMISKENYDEAILWCQKAIKIAESNNGEKSIAIYYNTIGSAYELKKEFRTALLFFEKALLMSENLGRTEEINNTKKDIERLKKMMN